MDLVSLIGTNLPIFLVFISVFLLCYYVLTARRNESFPPGPRMLPIIGNPYFLNNLRTKRVRLYHGMTEATKTYGDIIGFKVFGQRIVFLHGFDLINEAFVKRSDVTSNRPHWLDRLKEPTREGKGMVLSSFSMAFEIQKKYIYSNLNYKQQNLYIKTIIWTRKERS